MLKNPVNIDNTVLIKVNKWKDWILSPKLDGVRALLIVFNSAIYLLFEKKLELIVEHCGMRSNMVFETEVYNNGIYIYDLHYADNTFIYTPYL